MVNIHLNSRFYSRYYSIIIVFAFFISFTVLILVAQSLKSYGYDWDSQQILNQAIIYAEEGKIEAGYIQYVLDSPNNIALLTGMGVFFNTLKQIGITDFLGAAITLNVFILALTQVLIFLVAKMFYGRRIAAISILFSFVFISLSMYVHIAYTDTLAIIFPILLLYLSLQFVKVESIKLKILLSAVIGAVSTIGYLIKPTVIIAFIAITIGGTLWLLKTKKILIIKRIL